MACRTKENADTAWTLAGAQQQEELICRCLLHRAWVLLIQLDCRASCVCNNILVASGSQAVPGRRVKGLGFRHHEGRLNLKDVFLYLLTTCRVRAMGLLLHAMVLVSIACCAV